MQKIVIIGAGPAGLTAGYELLKQSGNYRVVILEKTEEIGGISRTISYHGNRMDIGGHRFFSKNQKVMDWWAQILPMQGAPAMDDKILGRKVEMKSGGPDPEQEDRVMLTRRRLSRIYYKKKFFDYPVKLNWNTIRNMGCLTTIEAGFSYLMSVFHKLPECSLENFYKNRFGKKLYTMFFEGYTQKVWGRHPSGISADWGAQRVKGLSIVGIIKDIFMKLLPGKRRNVETSLIEEFIYPKYGPGQLWETVADEIIRMGGEIRKNCEVVSIENVQNRIEAVTYLCNGQMIEEKADYVISSMPLQTLVAGMKQVPGATEDVARGLEYRDFVTVGLLVEKLKIKNATKWKTLNNIIPDCWIYVQDTAVKLGRIQIFNNWSPYLVKKPEETVWLGLEYFCSEQDSDWKTSSEGWIERGKNELVQMGIIDETEAILDAYCEKVEKAYPAYFGTYEQIGQVVEYLNHYENLFCVGRNGQHRYNNMDHSMLTSFETVHNILNKITSKENIWNVNTEQEYHEKSKVG